MRAVVQHGYGEPPDVLRVERRAVPRPGPGEVLVRIRATSVNTPDWIATTGRPTILRLKSGLIGPRSPIRGTDVAGVVAQVGEGVTDLAVGEEVFGSLWADSLDTGDAGTFAEFTVTSAEKLWRKPPGVSFGAAAASVMSGATALVAMTETVPVGPGQRVLVNGASGGVGTFAVQIAKHCGAIVTGVCSTANVDLVRRLGADEVVDYARTDLTDLDAEFDVILDNVLNHPMSVMRRLLPDDGVYLPNSIGRGGSFLAGLPRIGRAVLANVFGRVRVGQVNCRIDHGTLATLAELLESGDVEAIVGSMYPLDQAADAVGHMLTRHAVGNIVIEV